MEAPAVAPSAPVVIGAAESEHESGAANSSSQSKDSSGLAAPATKHATITLKDGGIRKRT